MRVRRDKGLERGWLHASFFAILLLLALSACGGGGGVAPKIHEFAAEPSTVAAGDTVVLSWQVENLEGGRLRLESLSESGAQPSRLGEVTPQSSTAVVVDETTTFRLIAASPAGTTSSETKVTVRVSEPESGAPEISFFRATPTSTSSGGAPVTLEWEVSGADRVVVEPPGGEVTTNSLEVRPYVSTVYTVTASNENGVTQRSLTVEVNTTDRLLFLIAGQSNASGAGLEEGGDFPTDATEKPQEGVLMLTPDLNWVTATEPSHAGFDPAYKHSFLLRFGKEVRNATGMDVFLVPAADGGTSLWEWQSDEPLFEEAVTRARFAATDLATPVAAVIWYQGESDTKSDGRRERFVGNTDRVLEGLRAELGNPEIIFVQLSKRLWNPDELNDPHDNIEGHNLAYQEVREWQRLMEAGANQSEIDVAAESSYDRPYYHMAVSHDLPMSDVKHLSAEGQRYLGRRLANTFLSEIYSGDVDGAFGRGPRLEGLSLIDERQTVLVQVSAPINESSDYDGYFTVFDNGEPVTPGAINRDSDPSRIRITFDSPLAGPVEVRYMPPQETELFTWSHDAVHSTVGELKLPLPAFGMPVQEPNDFLPQDRDSFPGLRVE